VFCVGWWGDQLARQIADDPASEQSRVAGATAARPTIDLLASRKLIQERSPWTGTGLWFLLSWYYTVSKKRAIPVERDLEQATMIIGLGVLAECVILPLAPKNRGSV